MSDDGVRDKLRTAGTVVIYGGSSFLILGALVEFSDGGFRGIVAAIVLLLAGLVGLPQTRGFVFDGIDRLGGPTVESISRPIAVVIVVVGLFTGAIIAGPSEDGAGTADPTLTETPSDALATADPGSTASERADSPSATAKPTGTPAASSDGSSSSGSTRTAGHGGGSQETASATKTTTPTQTSTSSGPRTQWTVTVIDVIDGDTMDVRFSDGSTDRIRLLGVDTPETSAGETDPAEWEGIPDSADGRAWLAEWGEQASDYASRQLSVGSEIYIEVDESADRRGGFDRLLVYAYPSESSSTSFNRRLLENGYARFYDTAFEERSSFAAAESTAQDSEVGVWDYSAPSTSTPTEQESGGGGGTGDIVVASVHADAAGNDHENTNDEYFALENTGSSAVDMGGWKVSDEADHDYFIPSGFTLGPGESVTIYTGSGSNSGSELYWGSDSAVWNNGGDTIYVTTDDGETVIAYEY